MCDDDKLVILTGPQLVTATEMESDELADMVAQNGGAELGPDEGMLFELQDRDSGISVTGYCFLDAKTGNLLVGSADDFRDAGLGFVVTQLNTDIKLN